jgi:hypothetical protein
MAQWAKDNVLVPQLPQGDPMRERLLSVHLVDLAALVPPFDPVPSRSAGVKLQHDSCRWVFLDYDPGHCFRVTQGASYTLTDVVVTLAPSPAGTAVHAQAYCILALDRDVHVDKRVTLM